MIIISQKILKICIKNKIKIDERPKYETYSYLSMSQEVIKILQENRVSKLCEQGHSNF